MTDSELLIRRFRGYVPWQLHKPILTWHSASLSCPSERRPGAGVCSLAAIVYMRGGEMSAWLPSALPWQGRGIGDVTLGAPSDGGMAALAVRAFAKWM
jgi:hypothetical protein